MCTICGKAFNETSKLKRHVKDVHETRKNFHCDKCNKGMMVQCGMLNHISTPIIYDDNDEGEEQTKKEIDEESLKKG